MENDTVNKLTGDESAAGFRLLFDGRTLSGWRTYNAATADAGWSVVDGAITYTPPPNATYGHDLVSEEEFTSFELRLRWKLWAAGNSGVFFHIREAEGRQPYESGPEFQLLDDDAHPDAKNGPLRRCGACYGLYPPLVRAQRSIGEWNETRILVDGDHVKQWLNGQLTAEYVLGSDDFNARVAASKFKEWPSFAAERRGRLMLQDHKDPVAFCDIRVRVL